jgi:hypothetical protein
MTLYALNEGDCDIGVEVIPGSWRKVDENNTLLGYYAVSSGNFLPAFWDNLPVPSS